MNDKNNDSQSESILLSIKATDDIIAAFAYNKWCGC